MAVRAVVCPRVSIGRGISVSVSVRNFVSVFILSFHGIFRLWTERHYGVVRRSLKVRTQLLPGTGSEAVTRCVKRQAHEPSGVRRKCHKLVIPVRTLTII